MLKYEEHEIIKNIDEFIENINIKCFWKWKIYNNFRTTDKLFKIIEEIIEKDIDDITILINDALEKSKLRSFLKNPKYQFVFLFMKIIWEL